MSSLHSRRHSNDLVACRYRIQVKVWRRVEDGCELELHVVKEEHDGVVRQRSRGVLGVRHDAADAASERALVAPMERCELRDPTLKGVTELLARLSRASVTPSVPHTTAGLP